MITPDSTTAEPTKHRLPLPGLDGANPLGFLAALGVLRALTIACDHNDPPRMAWRATGGTWTPQLICKATSEGELLDLLEQHLIQQFDRHPLSKMPIFKKIDKQEYHRTITSLIEQATLKDHEASDWIAALASDIVPPEANNQLQTVRCDNYQGNLASVMKLTERQHLERSLFSTWDYADALDNQSLHFDPSEDRQHAYQWNKPSGDPERKKSGGMLGANRLAIEALPLFVSVPENDRLHTLGFPGSRSSNPRWTWPLWMFPADLAMTRSLLSLAELQEREPSKSALRRLKAAGIGAALRTRRILVGRTTRNFTPPRRIA